MTKKPTYEEMEKRLAELEKLVKALQNKNAITLENERKLRSIYENAIEGFLQTTLEGRLISANPSMAAMLGYETADELINSISDIKNQLYVDPTRRDDLLQLLKRGDEVSNFEAQYYRKDKSIIWIFLNTRLVRDADGNPSYLEGFFTDITRRKKYENERDTLIKGLQDALNEIKTLRGIIPVCSHCKNIRNDEGVWNRMEEYIRAHADVQFSHSICPECARMHYPDLDIYPEDGN